MQTDAKFSELALRWMSAGVLIPFGLAVVWFGGTLLLMSCALFAGIMAFEWNRMSGAKYPAFLGLAGFASLALLETGQVFIPLLGVLVGSVANAIVQRGRRPALEGFNGLAYAVTLAWSLYTLREGPWDGLMATLVFMPLVWASDISAFFIGRHFGGPPLSVNYSPNKTWSGALGSLLICMLGGAVASEILGVSALPWLVAGALTSVVAQMGDFFESVQKRRLNAKDASGIIPGHGGVMDRVDGLGAMCFFWVVCFVLFPSLPKILGVA